MKANGIEDGRARERERERNKSHGLCDANFSVNSARATFACIVVDSFRGTQYCYSLLFTVL